MSYTTTTGDYSAIWTIFAKLGEKIISSFKKNLSRDIAEDDSKIKSRFIYDRSGRF